MKINLRCEAGHELALTIDDRFSLAWVKSFAGLLDDPTGQIGKCGICGAKLTATMEIDPLPWL